MAKEDSRCVQLRGRWGKPCMWRRSPTRTGSGACNGSCTREVRTLASRTHLWRARCTTKGACRVRERAPGNHLAQARQGRRVPISLNGLASTARLRAWGDGTYARRARCTSFGRRPDARSGRARRAIPEHARLIAQRFDSLVFCRPRQDAVQWRKTPEGRLARNTTTHTTPPCVP
jgi:hypothetical protein